MRRTPANKEASAVMEQAGSRRIIVKACTSLLKRRFRLGPRGRGTYAAAGSYAAAAVLIAALTRGMTSSAISRIERLASAGSRQSSPA